MDVVVGIADMKVSADPEATLITCSLGSCIGVVVYDPKVRAGGILHYMLPEAAEPDKAKDNPFMFANTGIPLLFKSCYELGAKKARMIVKVAGGSQIMKATEAFSIGQRNHGALRKIFFRNKVMIDAEDVGGSVARTMRFSIGTGVVSVRVPGQDYKVL